jgi:hypothetical protein
VNPLIGILAGFILMIAGCWLLVHITITKTQRLSEEYLKEMELFRLASIGDVEPLRHYLKTVQMVYHDDMFPINRQYRSSGNYISCQYNRSLSQCITRGAETYSQSWTSEPQMYGFTEDQGRGFTQLVVDSIRNRKITHSI